MLLAVTILLSISGILIVHAGESNVALNKPCSMSYQSPNQAEQYPCEKGNDGNTNQIMSEGSCFQSKRDAFNFWAVDLQAIYNISRIRIFNRLDAGAGQAKFIYVYVGFFNDEESWKEVGAFDRLPDIADIELPAGTSGDCVKLFQHDPNIKERKLQLCEIEVYAPDGKV